MTPDELILRADAAQRMLQDPLFREACETLERDIFEAWARTGIRDKEGQHELLLMLQTARKFKGIFEQIVMTGEFEKNALSRPRLKRTLERFGVYS